MGFLNNDFWDIYYQLKNYTSRIKCVDVPFDDIAQEIHIALITDKDNALKIASRNVDRLFKDYGYSKKLNGKDLFDPNIVYAESLSEEYYEQIEKRIAEIKVLYKSSSARGICNFYGVELTNEISQRLSIVFGGKKKFTKKKQKLFNVDEAKNIIKLRGLDNRCLRDWKWKGYIPSKYLL